MKVLVSACLLGAPVRYDGRDKKSGDPILERWIEEGRVVSVCPEVLA
ncbi:MAG: 2-thiouracil desulfurase family protein, partial [Thermoanaerobaculia bacterium]